MASSRCKKITLYISLFVLFGITFGFLMGFVYTTAQDRRAYTEGICTVKNLDIVASRCCKIQDCKCQECPIEAAPTCQKRLANLTVGTCCGEPKCCKECCSCTRNEPGDGPLLERGIGQDMGQSMGGGFEERGKGGGSKPSSPTCVTQCWCCEDVRHETCRSKCGTCFKITANFTWPLGKDNTTNLAKDTIEFSCGLDKFDCLEENKAKFQVGSVHSCWYKPDNGDYHVRLSEVKYQWWYLFIIALCGLLMLVIIVYLVVRKIWKPCKERWGKGGA